MLGAFPNRIRRWLHGRDLAVWHDAAYRLPLSALEARTGFEPRRADFAAWFLLESHAISRENLRAPRPASYLELSRVHSPELLESLTRAETLGRVFSVDASDLQVDQVLAAVLLACGATIEAAREMLRPAPRALGRRALNLSGGFHHAGPERAGGLCAINDVAVAVAAVRADGFTGRIAILDLDAHPPDGTAECLARDADCWIGSISGSDFGKLPRVDETLLPPGSGDAAYLAALEALLARMPEAQLAFVLAGGDVLEGDVAGQLALTLEGCRARDLRVADALLRTPSVWLPAGGYARDSWRVLAGTGLALGARSNAPIRPSYDPLGARYRSIAASLATAELGPAESIDAIDLEEELGIAQRPPQLLFGFYSLHGLDYALHRYGLMDELQRLGYGPLRVRLGHDGVGETVRIVDEPSGEVLVEVVLEKKRSAGAEMLYVHWLTLRNPRARFSELRPQLPGQDVPGLGLGREMTELFARMAARLGLEGVATRPSSYHTAYACRHGWRFVDPQRQGRFEALERDLAGLALLDATRAIAEGRVRMDGEPYQWEADEMALWLKAHAEDRTAIEAERERVKFTVG